jgi:hypothetical protein
VRLLIKWELGIKNGYVFLGKKEEEKFELFSGMRERELGGKRKGQNE